MDLIERFVAFFAALNNGTHPYPWQCSLVERIARDGRWPDICAPTGSGKSAVIDVHVFLVAEHAAGRLAVRPPRRLVLVAPRRVLVDDQFERSSRIAALLAKAAGTGGPTVLGEAANALLGLRTSDVPDQPLEPLQAWSLRGGVRLESGWRLEPAACQVICTTPQMWGSRLLLRGYNATRVSRNLEAGLLGHDAVAVIDEAHLHPRLVETARAIAGYAVEAAGLQVVAMSATQPAADKPVGLAAADLEDAALKRRVRAAKTIRLVAVEDWEHRLPEALVEEARRSARDTTTGVFVNDVPSALQVAAALAKSAQTVELVCGRLRFADLARLRKRRPGLLSPQGDPEVDYLVSTQSLEVGVDLDLATMVTTIASPNALAQRAGRLNRSGRWGESTLTVLYPAGLDDQIASEQPEQLARVPHAGPYRSEELANALRWLRGLDGSISPEAVSTSSMPTVARPLLPKLRRGDLQTLAMSTDIQAADPDIELYLADPEADRPEVAVVARKHLDLEPAVVKAALLACPPRQHELATMSLGKALDRVVKKAGDGAWVLRSVDGSLAAIPLPKAEALRGRDTLVVPHGARICTAGVVGLPEAKGAPGVFDDVLEEAPPGTAQDRIVALPAAAVAPLTEEDPVLGTRAARRALADVLNDAGEPDLARQLRAHRRLSELDLVWCGGEGDASTGLIVIRDMRHRGEQVVHAVPAEPITLDQHQHAVEQRMGAILDRLGVNSDEAEMQRLMLAARIHDEGKRHPRFQRRMGADGTQLAKPSPGHVPDRGDGWRHEQLSAAYAADACQGDPLVVALVCAHHGRGRPLFDRDADGLLAGWTDCPQPIAAWASRLFGPSGNYELLRAIAQERHGVHGLCWREALLRCADMQVSSEGG